MNIKRIWTTFISCILVIGCLCMSGAASEQKAETISMGEMQGQVLNSATVERVENQVAVRASGRVNVSISANTIMTVDYSFLLAVNDTITYDCTYIPKSASVDFGFLAPDGKFYSVPGFNGSINTTIRVSQSGSYTLAIRNNAAYAVTVTGTVNY